MTGNSMSRVGGAVRAWGSTAVWVCAACGILWIAAIAVAQDVSRDDSESNDDRVSTVVGLLRAIEENEEEEKLPSIEETVKGFDLINNNLDKREATFFKLWRKDDELIAELPAGLLDKPWLLSSTLAAGPYLTGFQLGSAMLEWRRKGKELQLVEPEVRYIASAGGANAQNVRRSYTDRYVLSVPLIAEDEGQSVAINLSSLLVGNSQTLVGWIGSIRGETARVEKAKAFADNVEVEITAASGFWFFRSTLMTLHYSLSALPEKSTYTSRKADQRVGYWVHAKQDFSKHDPLRDDLVRVIERWDLQKANPKLRISPPKKPIVIYIERSVPIEYRRYVRKGIEAWNEAFRAIGFDNAIEVRQQTDTQYVQLDPEDVRYNFVRWITTGGAFAIALHRVDPRTGQILDGDILIDDSWVDVWVDEYPLMIERAWRGRLEALAGMGGSRQAQIEHLNQRARSKGLLPAELTEQQINRGPETLTRVERRVALERLTLQGDGGVLGRNAGHRLRCTYATRLSSSMAMAQMAWLAGAQATDADDDEADEEKKDQPETEDGEPLLDGVPERLIGENLVALTAHEVGHILGLRHNFKGSAWKPISAYDEYRDPGQEPPVASVMDYSGTFIAPKGTKQGLYNMQRVGVYDRWAIACGYKPVKDDAELEALLAQSVKPANNYGTDEDVFSPDPTAMSYDAGNDPVAFRLSQLAMIDRLRGQLVSRLSKKGENYARVWAGFMRLFWEELFSLWDTTGWIGGTILNRDYNTEGAPAPLVNIAPEQQRAVLDMLIDRAFSPGSFQFDPDLLNRLQQEKWYQSNFPWWSGWGGGDFDVNDYVNIIQFVLLSDLFNWSTPRLLNQELRTDPDTDALTLPEMHRKLTDAIWKEFEQAPKADDVRYTNMKPRISMLRRNLQREHAEQLIDLALSRWAWLPTVRQPQIIAMSELRRIRGMLDRFSAVPEQDLDDYTRIHIEELKHLIDAALDAQVTRSR